MRRCFAPFRSPSVRRCRARRAARVWALQNEPDRSVEDALAAGGREPAPELDLPAHGDGNGRSPTTAARSSCSTSGPPGASPAARSRRCSSAGTAPRRQGGDRARGRRPRRVRRRPDFVASTAYLPDAARRSRRRPRRVRHRSPPRDLRDRPRRAASRRSGAAPSTRSSCASRSRRCSRSAREARGRDWRAARWSLLASPRRARRDCPKTTLGDIEDEVMCPVCGTPLGLATEAPQAQRERALHPAPDRRLPLQGRDQARAGRPVRRTRARPARRRRDDDGFERRARLRHPGARPSCSPPAAIAFAVHPLAQRRRGAAARPAGRGGRRPRRRRHGALRPVIAADAVDTTVVAAFAVGFISFISPCVLPLVPGYLSTISGVSFADIQEGARSRAGARPGAALLPRLHGHVRRARDDGHRPRPDAPGPPPAAAPDLGHRHRR